MRPIARFISLDSTFKLTFIPEMYYPPLHLPMRMSDLAPTDKTFVLNMDMFCKAAAQYLLLLNFKT
jgi:hypothetical protein